MATELDHSFTTDKSIEDSFAAITDLERVVPAVEGGRVIEPTGPDSVKAEIVMKMGAMTMKMLGTVEVVEQDAAGSSCRAASEGQGGRGPGSRQRGRDLPAQRRRRNHPYEGTDHG